MLKINKGDILYSASYDFYTEDDIPTFGPDCVGKVEYEIQEYQCSVVHNRRISMHQLFKIAYIHPLMGFNQDKQGRLIAHRTGRSSVKTVYLNEDNTIKNTNKYHRLAKSKIRALAMLVTKINEDQKRCSYKMNGRQFNKLKGLIRGRMTKLRKQSR